MKYHMTKQGRVVSCVLVAWLLFAVPASARPRHWYTDWKWWVGESVIVTAVVLDGKSTCDGFKRGLVEGNFVLRGSTSCGKNLGLLVVEGAVQTGLHAESYRLLRDDPSPTWRAVSLVTVPVIACSFHCTAAARNFSLNSHTSPQ